MKRTDAFNSFKDLPVQRAAMNSLFVIAPYKYEGMWVFDYPAVGLLKETIHCRHRYDDHKVVAGKNPAVIGITAINLKWKAGFARRY